LGRRPSVYFWRDAGGAHEVDCILDQGAKSYPVEIKAGKMISSDSLRGIEYWNNIANAKPRDSYLIYANKENQIRKQGNVIGWQDAATLVEKVSGKK
jgi:predicted AAA+ superfamily ATPase